MLKMRLQVMLIVLIAFAVQSCTPPVFRPAKNIPENISAKQLIKRFESIVFFSEFSDRRGTLFRVGNPIFWYVQGAGADRAKLVLPKIFARLSELTGLAMQMARDDGAANMHIFVDQRKNLLQLPVIQNSAHQGFVYDATCWATRRKAGARPRGRSDLGKYDHFVGVPTRLNAGGLETCLWIEITQSLGLPNDVEDLQPSIFSDEGYLVTGDLPWYDALLVRAVYDARFRAGMTLAQAKPVARRIIPELLAYWRKHRKLPANPNNQKAK